MPVAALPEALRGATNARALSRFEAAERSRPRPGSSRSYLDDEDDALLARHDVYLEPSEAEVRGHDDGARLLEMANHRIFGALAERVCASDAFRRFGSYASDGFCRFGVPASDGFCRFGSYASDGFRRFSSYASDGFRRDGSCGFAQVPRPAGCFTPQPVGGGWYFWASGS